MQGLTVSQTVKKAVAFLVGEDADRQQRANEVQIKAQAGAGKVDILAIKKRSVQLGDAKLPWDVTVGGILDIPVATMDALALEWLTVRGYDVCNKRKM